MSTTVIHRNKIYTVTGTAFWCFNARESKFGGYGLELGCLDKEAVKVFKEVGIPVKFDTENDEGSANYKGYFVKLKNDNPFAAKDMTGKVLPSQLQIGNGSKVWAAFRAKPWQHVDTGRAGVRGIILGLKVLSLVQYDPEAANLAAANEMLDGISGAGFVFGENGSPDETTSSVNQDDIDALFSDD